jgi:hypothetical protein
MTVGSAGRFEMNAYRQCPLRRKKPNYAKFRHVNAKHLLQAVRLRPFLGY